MVTRHLAILKEELELATEEVEDLLPIVGGAVADQSDTTEYVTELAAARAAEAPCPALEPRGGIGHVRAADVHWMPLRVHVCVPCNPSDNHAAGQLGIRAADRPDGPLQQTVRARPPAWSPATRPATTRRAQS